MTLAVVGPALVAFLLGARHGLDWDHLAAIADLVGGAGQRGRRQLGLAVWYCVGHGAVIVLLGALVGLLGVRLPNGLDLVFETVVGLTLVVLGVLVLWQVGRQGTRYQFVSRWRLLLDLLRRVWLRRRGQVAWDRPAALDRRTAFGIGVLHGTGAETPTQVALFAGAAASGTPAGAALVLGAFVAGLIASDTGVAALWVTGRATSIRLPGAQMALGLLTGLASLVVGVLFVLHRSATLPALFGG
jgi:High-affinity nickel-transport protein